MTSNVRRSFALFGLAILLAACAVIGIYLNRQWFHTGDHVGIAQAAAGIVFGVPTSVFAVAAVIAALRAADASEAQVQAALAQAEAARAQSALAGAQLKESLRPVILIKPAELAEDATLDSPLLPMMLSNLGSGTARHMTLAFFVNGPFHNLEIDKTLPMLRSVLPAGQSIVLPVIEEFDDDARNIIVFYESMSGDRYCSTYYRLDGSVSWNYEDNPPIWPS